MGVKDCKVAFIEKKFSKLRHIKVGHESQMHGFRGCLSNLLILNVGLDADHMKNLYHCFKMGILKRMVPDLP